MRWWGADPVWKADWQWWRESDSRNKQWHKLRQTGRWPFKLFIPFMHRWLVWRVDSLQMKATYACTFPMWFFLFFTPQVIPLYCSQRVLASLPRVQQFQGKDTSGGTIIKKKSGLCCQVPVLMLILDKSRAHVEQLGWRTWPKFHPKIGCGTPELRLRSKVYGSGLCTKFYLVLLEFSTREKGDEVTASGNETGWKGRTSIMRGRRGSKGEKKKRGKKKNQSGQGRKGIRLRLNCFSCYPKRALNELTQKRECRREGSSSCGGGKHKGGKKKKKRHAPRAAAAPRHCRHNSLGCVDFSPNATHVEGTGRGEKEKKYMTMALYCTVTKCHFYMCCSSVI